MRFVISYGDVYIQMPDDDLEAIEFAIEFLDFLLRRRP